LAYYASLAREVKSDSPFAMSAISGWEPNQENCPTYVGKVEGRQALTTPNNGTGGK
jgi:hypothetical protein